eukprot:CAMPEP_0167745146 /NCGR_PEP_ID=MMETSP0110_2-20121227/2987_1 /TAXON_ID=629695 /ORGANISM="Gymnochlora sp., Strain CCMP2014" /LENGTH=769 /DNA_ID=CAMNT_0007629751 /DNA_START=133 /DNA_END=2442 /DNA_ORIENTATION=-
MLDIKKRINLPKVNSFENGVRCVKVYANEDKEWSFDEMQRVNIRIKKLLDTQVSTMTRFWNPDLNCFSIQPFSIMPDAPKRYSLSTTCIALYQLLEDSHYWKGIAGIAPTSEINIRKMFDKLSYQEWTYDEFQTTPYLLTALYRLQKTDPGNPNAFHVNDTEKMEKAVHVSVERLLSENMQSVYLLYWHVLSLVHLMNSGDDRVRIRRAVVKSGQRAFNEMCRQIAAYYAEDVSNFDITRLIYSILTYHRVVTSVQPPKDYSFASLEKGTQNSGSNGERVYGKLLSAKIDGNILEIEEDGINNLFDGKISHESPSVSRGYTSTWYGNSESVPLKLNMKILQKALKIVFDEQRSDGLWDKGQPIQGDDARRDIGNSYVFAFDMLGSLVGEFEKSPEILRDYLPQLKKSLEWAEANFIHPDVSVGGFGGWRSNHLKPGLPLAWCTAQVYYALSKMRTVFRNMLHESVLQEFDGISITRSKSTWEELMDSDIATNVSLKSIVSGRILGPISKVEEDKERKFGSIDGTDVSPREKPSYSVVLFGPPGTAKTTICSAMAKYLGWDLVTVDTAEFLADGLHSVAARMSYIFERLKALENSVILFDEIEEFCMDREDPRLSMESRLLTTAMLTQLNDLRRQESSIFVIATNRLKAFDKAITRPGRIDLTLFVGVPNFTSRVDRLAQKFKDSGFLEEKMERDLALATDFMQAHWEQELRFFTYAENEKFLNKVVAIASMGEIKYSSLIEALQKQIPVSMIQGTLKNEYLEMERLTRL